jgi:hypothetical protein
MTDNNRNNNYNNKEINEVFQNIVFHREKTSSNVSKPENVKLYWHIGQYIFEKLQNEEDRAEYASYIIKSLSKKLTFEIGKGFSERRLKDMRKLFITFPKLELIDPRLGWTQLRILMRIKDEGKRGFYIKLCLKDNLSTRVLEDKIKSSIYEQFINM